MKGELERNATGRVGVSEDVGMKTSEPLNLSHLEENELMKRLRAARLFPL